MENSAPEEQMSVEELIREKLRREPIKSAPWRVAQFFENEDNIGEEFLDKSLDKLAEILPEFEENHREIIEELQKLTLLAVPMFRKLQLMTILTIVREACSSSQAFPLLPDFPKPPAANLLNHIFRDNSLSDEEKKLEFQQIAKSTPEVLQHLISWRDHVAAYVDGLAAFLGEHGKEMSEEQKEHVALLSKRSHDTILRINTKIQQKEDQSEEERREFEKFHVVLSRDAKYAEMEPEVARAQIQRVFNETDHTVRRILAESALKTVKAEPVEPEDVLMESETVVTKKRASDGGQIQFRWNQSQKGENDSRGGSRRKTDHTGHANR
ncbi:unnamed protein product [Caenorhabditis sp. 36 PRJEB53466]|nr:unnamed protein product [Caenorhabditis sp. 36 PRJEB53466]